MGAQARFEKLALRVSDTDRARQFAQELRDRRDWCPPEEAQAVVVVGGDGFMLQTLHQMLDEQRVIPAYGINLGTVGFLMNNPRKNLSLSGRLDRAKAVAVAPLRMVARMHDGSEQVLGAINEVSLLRETRQTARLEIMVDGKVRIEELVCDGVLLATPAGSTAYNLSANGPILPLGSNMLALTPISAFRPRRWRGAILPDKATVAFRVMDPGKRPVSAVADQRELRDIAEVEIAISRDDTLTLLFDPGHALDERIVAEQFMT